MRIACLGSGSRGNATLVQADDTCVLVDCGFSVRELERRLAALDLGLDSLGAVLVTHEHGDHINGVSRLARRCGIPVHATRGTARFLDEDVAVREIKPDGEFRVGALEVMSYAVPHDASEPCQFVIGAGGARFGMLTDTGHVTPHILRSLAGCRVLYLECNHDSEMLQNGRYPPALKARVAGRYGHLSNDQAAGLLAALAGEVPHTVVAAHLSEKNNEVELAHAALSTSLAQGGSAATRIHVAEQDAVLGWIEVD